MTTVLVTGIGGNVGQGILRNLRQDRPGFRLVGTDIHLVNGGSHLCDKTYVLPYAYERTYLDVVREVLRSETVDLIIPSTDYETYYLSTLRAEIPIVACSPPETNEMFLDKFTTYQLFGRAGLPFAQTTVASEYTGPSVGIVAKPREGRGSRGVIPNPSSVSRFGNDYVIQPLLTGGEITTSFFIDRNRRLHGMITFRRMLSAGTTILCEVVDDYDGQLLAIVSRLNECVTIRGSCNIQSMVTKDNEIVPFEVNGRISGTNSIRSHFGFKDVEYTVRDFLTGETLEPVVIKKGCAARILMDVIFPEQTLATEKNRYVHFELQ